MKLVKYLTFLLGLVSLIGFVVYYEAGLGGFYAFVNIPGIVLLVIGTTLATLMTFTVSEIFLSFKCALFNNKKWSKEQLVCARQMFSGLCNTSVAFGCIGTIISLIMILRTIEDAAVVPKRLALALSTLFFGLFISEIVFAPLKRNVEKYYSVLGISESSNRIRILLVALCVFVLISALFAILYAMNAHI